MNTWVTGGAGFLGGHLVEALVGQGQRPVVIDDLSTGLRANVPGEAILLERNVTSLGPEDFEAHPVDVIYHLAGDALVSRSVADPVADCHRNLLPALHLLECLRKYSPSTRLLFASTGAVYGENASRPFVESDGLYPISPYAVAKLAAERYCFAYARTYGLATCSLRLFSVYGPRQRKQVVYDLIRKLHASPGRIELFGDGTQERDFSHAANIVDAFLLAAEKANFEGEAINVAGDEIVSIGELLSILCERMQCDPQVAYTGHRRPGDSQRWIADTSRLRSLGYAPRVPLRQGLDSTIQWYRKHPE